jgi:probable F420-dependent oxidoreductase
VVRFGLWYDFRNPARWRVPFADKYAATFEQIRDAEALGYDDIWTTEHHFIDDGYAPSLMTICAAIAARTSRVRIGTAVLLLPMHDPVRLAEDAATVDIISNGRLDLGVGLGYRLGEFKAFGIDWATRGRRLDEAATILRRAWSSETLNVAGEFYCYSEANVTPKPVQEPMPLWFGGLSPAAVSRAARLGTGFIAGAGTDLIPHYIERCATYGHAPGTIARGLGFDAVADDPERAWQQVREHVYYQRRMYVEWLNAAGTEVWPLPDGPESVRATDPDIVVTPERAVALVRAALAAHPEITHLYWSPLLPGLSPAVAMESIELFARKVMPEFRGANGGTR